MGEEHVRVLLQEAERYWRANNRKAALKNYDKSLEITRRLANKDMEGKILLGKGFALMQPARDTGAIGDPKMDIANLKLGVECLIQARDIALDAGRTNQAAFVQKIVDQKGKLILEHQHRACASSDGCQSTKDQCTDQTSRVANAVAQAVTQAVTQQKAIPVTTPEHIDVTIATTKKADAAHAAATPVPQPHAFAKDALERTVTTTTTTTYGIDHGVKGESGFWNQARIERLVKLIADHDVGDWSAKAKILNNMDVHIHTDTHTDVNPHAARGKGVHGGEVAKMWLRIKPIVKKQLTQDSLAERACGHSCGTCPTRPTCHLHAAVDIEDM